jgi:O-antigen ligase
MATAVLLGLWVVLPDHRSLWRRAAVLAAIAALGVGLFYTPIFQERFFTTEGSREYEGRGTLGQVLQGDFSGSGRFDVWPLVWQETRDRHLLFGAGAGQIGDFADRAFTGKSFATPLNDYLRLLYEYGVVGLALFLAAVIGHLAVIGRRCRTAPDDWWPRAAFLGFVALLGFAVTENVVIYGVYFLNPLLVLAGASGAAEPVAAAPPVVRPARAPAGVTA